MTHLAPETPAGTQIAVRCGIGPVARPATGLLLAWSISRSAANACGLVPDDSGPSVRLEVCVDPPVRDAQAGLEARVLDGERALVLGTSGAQGTWIQDSIRGVWHLDIENLLKLTIRLTGQTVEALYARTELLARAGVAGGRYEFDGVMARTM